MFCRKVQSGSLQEPVRWTGKPGEYRPYHLETVVIFGIGPKDVIRLKNTILSMDIQ